MSPTYLRSGDLASALPSGGLTLVSSCSAQSDLLVSEVAHASAALGDMTFSGIFVPGLNKATWNAGPQSQVLTFFQTPDLAREGARSQFLPLCYQDVLANYRRQPPAAALFMCSPPDANGLCSFGTEVAFIAALWRDIPTRIAHINPAMPRTPGDPGIHFTQLTAYYEGDQPLKTMASGASDTVSDAIATLIAPYIPNGALELVRSGAMAPGASALAGVAIGSPDLYAGLDHPHFQFRPVTTTHDPQTLANIDGLVTINSAMEVDLYGQVHAEASARGFMSGPGGAGDYARAARVGQGGLRIIALPASAGAISRIVPQGAGHGPVSLSRFDVDLVVTEHGIADLRFLGHEARAQALIAIADPAAREELTRSWRNGLAKLQET